MFKQRNGRLLADIEAIVIWFLFVTNWSHFHIQDITKCFCCIFLRLYSTRSRKVSLECLGVASRFGWIFSWLDLLPSQVDESHLSRILVEFWPIWVSLSRVLIKLMSSCLWFSLLLYCSCGILAIDHTNIHTIQLSLNTFLFFVPTFFVAITKGERLNKLIGSIILKKKGLAYYEEHE